MEKFLELSNAIKITIILVICGIFILAIFLLGRPSAEVANQNVVGIPNGTNSTVSPDPTPTPEPTVEFTPGTDNGGEDLPPLATAEEGTNDAEGVISNLSNEDGEAAMSVATNGILAYYTINKDEPISVRQTRLTGIIDSTSPIWLSTPLGDSVPEEGVVQVATIAFAEPVGGTAEDFRALVSINVKATLSNPSDIEDVPQAFSTRVITEVAVKKVGEQWLIWAYREQ